MEQKKDWKKIVLIGLTALVVPGGFIALGIYGIKKLWDKQRSKDVSPKRSEERPLSDS